MFFDFYPFNFHPCSFIAPSVKTVPLIRFSKNFQTPQTFKNFPLIWRLLDYVNLHDFLVNLSNFLERYFQKLFQEYSSNINLKENS